MILSWEMVRSGRRLGASSVQPHRNRRKTFVRCELSQALREPRPTKISPARPTARTGRLDFATTLEPFTFHWVAGGSPLPALQAGSQQLETGSVASDFFQNLLALFFIEGSGR
jgi:hypothetical protein